MIPSSWHWTPRYTVPRLPAAPRVDGQLDESPWRYSSEISALIDTETSMQARQNGSIRLGWIDRDLVVGYELNRPSGSGKPRVSVEEAGWSRVPLWVQDDNIELWLSPYAQGVGLQGMMSPAYTIAANAAGAYSHNLTSFDRPQIPRQLKYATHVLDNRWTGELRVPWEVMKQVPSTRQPHAPKEGTLWTSAIFFHQLTPNRAVMGLVPGLQKKGTPFSELRFSDQPVGYAVSAVKPLPDRAGYAGFEVEVRNGSDEPVECELAYQVFRKHEIPRSEDEQFFSYYHWVKRIEAVGRQVAGTERGGILHLRTKQGVLDLLNREYDWHTGGQERITADGASVQTHAIDFAAEEGYYVVGYQLTDAATGELLMHQVIPVTIARLPVQVRPEFLQAKKIVLRADIAAVASAEPGDRLIATIVHDDQVIVRSVRELASVVDPIEMLIPTDDVQPGMTFDLQVRLQRGNSDKVVAETSRQITHPPIPEWYGHQLGTVDRVPDDFEPIKKTAKGFAVAMRRYEFDGAALPSQIMARDEPLLDGPTTLKAVVDGRTVELRPGNVKVLQQKPTQVRFEQMLSGQALNVKIVGTLDYDGFIRYRLDVKPAENAVQIDHLSLEIPLKADYARWFSHRDLGTAVSGSRPHGPEFPYGTLDDFFAHYTDGWMPFTWQLFLGSHDRGLEWVAESDRAWSPKDEERMIEVRRDEKRVSAVFHFVDQSVELNAEGRTFEFGLTATPVRDFPRSRYFQWERAGGLQIRPHVELAPQNNPNYQQMYARLADYGIDVVGSYVNLGPALFSNIRFYEADVLSRIRGANELAHDYGMINNMYCGYALPPGIPDNETYGEEMRMEPAFRGWYLHASPFLDYALHSAKFMIDNAAVDSFHTDGLPMVWLATNVTHDYRWERDGVTHGTWPVFAVRELFKRFYHMVKFDCEEEKYHMPHVVDAPVYCIESFTDLEVSGEQHYGTISKLKDLGFVRYRMSYDTTMQGIPRMGIWHYVDDIAVTKQMMQAIHHLHGVHFEYQKQLKYDHSYEIMGGSRPIARMFANFGRERATFLPYWKHPDLCQIEPDTGGEQTIPSDVQVSAYRHSNGKQALLIIANIDTQGYSLRVTPSPEALGLPGEASDYDASDPILGGYGYPRAGSAIRLDVAPQRWRAVWLRPAVD
jgi:hypothetical protein